MKSINIVALPNGVGISRDIKIITDILEPAGFRVSCSHLFRMDATRKHDLNIFLERLTPTAMGTAKLNCMIPNQEWFEIDWIPLLKNFQLVLAKTRYAEEIFKELGCNTEFVSFTSEDRYVDGVKKDAVHWLHLVGKSVQKQTETVYRTWQRNPGFPQLTIIQDPRFWRPRTGLRNVTYMNDRVPEEILRVMQNAYAVHVCPSETEGFGHYIMEAMSAKAMVVATDAEPMNELVTPERGILVNPVSCEPMRLSMAYTVNEKSLEDAVMKATIMPDAEIAEKGEKARKFYLDNDAFFKRQFLHSIRNLLQV
jgi:glycosyltransferase involved in cell wall biosynthesis